MAENRLDDLIVKKLYSNYLTDVIYALNEIQEKGNSRYIPLLVDVLHSSKENEISELILKILSEAKHPDIVPELIKAIEDEKYINEQEELVRTCWENGLDYTNYFSTFVNLLINGNYMTAFEAYTVIENTEGFLSDTSAKEYIATLQNAIFDANDERKILIQSIVHFLPSIIKA